MIIICKAEANYHIIIRKDEANYHILIRKDEAKNNTIIIAIKLECTFLFIVIKYIYNFINHLGLQYRCICGEGGGGQNMPPLPKIFKMASKALCNTFFNFVRNFVKFNYITYSG